MSFLALSSCMIFSGRIDNPNNPLGAGMEMDVLNLYGLLVTSPMSVEGLDQIELKPQQLAQSMMSPVAGRAVRTVLFKWRGGGYPFA